ncbi:Mitochondrial-processing peptidase subunit alpha, partial [Dinochytrium kinnereticum]
MKPNSVLNLLRRLPHTSQQASNTLTTLPSLVSQQCSHRPTTTTLTLPVRTTTSTSSPSRSLRTTPSTSQTSSRSLRPHSRRKSEAIQTPPQPHLEEACPTIVTTLPNGIKVASQDAPGHFVTVGVYVEAGTRFETDRTAGASHVLDRLAFKSTENMTTEQLITQLERLGGNIMAHSARENMTYQAAVFRKDLPEAVKVLAEVVARPKILPEELEEVKETTRFEIKESEWRMDVVLPERLHAVAFGGVAGVTADGGVDGVRPVTGSGIASGIRSLFGKKEGGEGVGGSTNGEAPTTLGRPLLCDVDTLDRITPEVIQEYRSTWFTPDRMVI